MRISRSKETMGETGYQSLERRVGEHLMPLTRDIIMANLLEEIALSPRNPDGTVDLVASYDMGWQKRSSGNSYDSPSGHAFLVGSRTKKIIAMIVMAKQCSKCDA